MQKIAVVGSGGREHAFVTALARCGHDVYCLPGNPGIPGSVAAQPLEFEADLFVIGSENDCVSGLPDDLRSQGKLVLGPGADGAQLEGSKAWMKDLLRDAGVPTARYFICHNIDQADAAITSFGGNCVVKTDYLAGGKGVNVFSQNRYDALTDAVAKLAKGAVVIEELLPGWEFSFFVLCDGLDAVPFGTAQDYKRLLDDDQGPNTGGMGAYSPVAEFDFTREIWMMENVIRPTIEELKRRDINYRGFLYAGMMMTPDGPKVLEYNIRFGDPEAQVVLPRLADDCDLGEILSQAAAGHLVDVPHFSNQAAVTVVLAADGYPVQPRKGDAISGLGALLRGTEAQVYFAGVRMEGEGPKQQIITNGGRVLAVTGVEPTLDQARRSAYNGAAFVSWDGMQYRSDIAASPR